jgi:hypothetical protein
MYATFVLRFQKLMHNINEYGNTVEKGREIKLWITRPHYMSVKHSEDNTRQNTVSVTDDVIDLHHCLYRSSNATSAER